MTPTPPPEQLTEDQRQAITKSRTHAFLAPATNITIPKLDGANNWDQWYNSLLGMSEITNIDGILTGNDPLPVQGDKEKDLDFNNRSIY